MSHSLLDEIEVVVDDVYQDRVHLMEMFNDVPMIEYSFPVIFLLFRGLYEIQQLPNFNLAMLLYIFDLLPRLHFVPTLLKGGIDTGLAKSTMNDDSV